MNTLPSLKWIAAIILALINIIAFILVAVDKRKSESAGRRVPEVYFFVWAIFMASPGVLAGMFVFRHKTRKLSFVLGIGLLLIQQTLLAYLLYKTLA